MILVYVVQVPDEIGMSVVGHTKIGTGGSVGEGVGDLVAPNTVGPSECTAEGCSDGRAVIVGRAVMVGEVEGREDGANDTVGLALGAPVGSDDGDVVGLRVGMSVAYQLQKDSLASIHFGVKESNCSIVSNTEEKGHN